MLTGRQILYFLVLACGEQCGRNRRASAFQDALEAVPHIKKYAN